MAKPVRARTKAAVARSTGPTIAASRASSTRSAPDASTSTGSSRVTDRKTRDFTICEMSQPIAEAASAADRGAIGHLDDFARDSELA